MDEENTNGIEFEKISNQSFAPDFLDTLEQIHYARIVKDNDYELPIF